MKRRWIIIALCAAALAYYATPSRAAQTSIPGINLLGGATCRIANVLCDGPDTRTCDRGAVFGLAGGGAGQALTSKSWSEFTVRITRLSWPGLFAIMALGCAASESAP